MAKKKKKKTGKQQQQSNGASHQKEEKEANGEITPIRKDEKPQQKEQQLDNRAEEEEPLSEEESSSSSDESSDDGKLSLDGVLLQDDDDDDEDDDDEEKEEEDDDDEEKEEDDDEKDGGKPVVASRKRKRKSKQPDVTQVDFTFCDMNERYFHGVKSLLHGSSTVYQQHASQLADHMIENVAVGTVVSVEGDVDGNVFGFASILSTHPQVSYASSPALAYLKEYCLGACPEEYKSKLKDLLFATKPPMDDEEEGSKKPAASSPSNKKKKQHDATANGKDDDDDDKTKHPVVGFMLHGRMVNLPLQVVHVLHQQLILDMDWAVKNANGGDQERQALDFDYIVRMAPCQLERTVAAASKKKKKTKKGKKKNHDDDNDNNEGGGGSGMTLFRFFDDEIMAGRAEFQYMMDAPKSYSKEEKQMLCVMVMTQQQYRAAIEQDLAPMIT